MDTLRGNFPEHDSPGYDFPDYDPGEEEAVRELPPSAIGQDERRMQVRAYNFWAGLLADRSFPSVEELDPDNLPDFGPHSVLLDFTSGIDNPAIAFLGDELAKECGTTGPIKALSDVPSRSLLSRITDHYLQIIANQAPIGFEAEFVNQRGATIMYRGILLPFSSDDDTIDFIYGVINWKELADQQTSDELLLEIDQALASTEAVRIDEPLTDWADGPLDSSGIVEQPPMDTPGWEQPTLTASPWGESASADAGENTADDDELDEDDGILELVTPFDPDVAGPSAAAGGWPEPDFGNPQPLDLGIYEEPAAAELPPLEFTAAVTDVALATDTDPDSMELADWLASAREFALAAQGADDRSRQALYAAVGRAYDFSLAAAADPDGFAELLADAGLVAQERAPLTPLVKLVFGATYDKTRLAEYAAVLGHAHRLGLDRGTLADFLSAAPGGLKGIVAEDRRLRRAEAGDAAAPRIAPAERLAAKLRKVDHCPLASVSTEGSEFTLLVARRMPNGEVVLIGEVADDVALLERAARKLIG